jgi:hypothetical protein
MITIHWQALECPWRAWLKQPGRFTDLLTKALARHMAAGTAWLWIHENVPGNGHDKGGHCHLLAHVPADLVSLLTSAAKGLASPDHRAALSRASSTANRLAGGWGWRQAIPNSMRSIWQAALAYV